MKIEHVAETPLTFSQLSAGDAFHYAGHQVPDTLLKLKDPVRIYGTDHVCVSLVDGRTYHLSADANVKRLNAKVVIS